GAIQLSWNYNYIDASKALTGSSVLLCQSPDLVATDPVYAWGTALWFWTMNTGSVGKTCSTAILTDGDFGGTINAINGGFPFTLYPLSLDWLSNYFLLLPAHHRVLIGGC
ncbi:hypothetical protein ACHAXN_000075, partial [Cyclotella atomus]